MSELAVALEEIATYRSLEPSVSNPHTANYYEIEIRKLTDEIRQVEAPKKLVDGKLEGGKGNVGDLPMMRAELQGLENALASLNADGEKITRAEWLLDFADAMQRGMAETSDRENLEEAAERGSVSFKNLVAAWCSYAGVRHELDAHSWFVEEAGLTWDAWALRLPLGRIVQPGEAAPIITPLLLADTHYVETVTYDYLQHTASQPKIPASLAELRASGDWEETRPLSRAQIETMK